MLYNVNMANFKAPADRRSAHLAIRLTYEEKAIADYLAEISGTSLTDMISGMIKRRAARLGVRDVPKKPRRGPGRPRKG
jgi:hypothetical protein